MTEDDIWRWSCDTRRGGDPRPRDLGAGSGRRVALAHGGGQRQAQCGNRRSVRCGARCRGSRRSRSRRGGCAARAAARRAGDDQGKRRSGRMRDDQRRRRLSRHDRASDDSPAVANLEERRRDHHRPHQHAGLQLSARHRQRLARPHLQSVVARRIRRAARRAARRRRSPPASRRWRTATTSPARCAFPPIACGMAGIRPSFGRVPVVQPDAGGGALDVVAADVGAGSAGDAAVADVRVGLAAMAARDARDPWWVPAPLAGPAPPQADARRRRDRCRATSPGRSFTARLQPRSTRRGARLADAGYEIVDERTPGFTRARNCGSRCRCRSFATTCCR